MWKHASLLWAMLWVWSLQVALLLLLLSTWTLLLTLKRPSASLSVSTRSAGRGSPVSSNHETSGFGCQPADSHHNSAVCPTSLTTLTAGGDDATVGEGHQTAVEAKTINLIHSGMSQSKVISVTLDVVSSISSRLTFSTTSILFFFCYSFLSYILTAATSDSSKETGWSFIVGKCVEFSHNRR